MDDLGGERLVQERIATPRRMVSDSSRLSALLLQGRSSQLQVHDNNSPLLARVSEHFLVLLLSLTWYRWKTRLPTSERGLLKHLEDEDLHAGSRGEFVKRP